MAWLWYILAMAHIFHTDIVVVGSGPGGATIARELARQGRRVLILERGIDHRQRFYYGTYVGALRYADHGSLLYSREGMQIIRPLMVGGATSMYCGCAALPPDWLLTRYGVDIRAEVAETIAELRVAPLPAGLRGVASTRIAEAGQACGYAWTPQPKLMSPAVDQPFACSANCMLGCRCGAKWNAGTYVDQAVAAGAQLITSALVQRVVRNGHKVVGVEGRINGQPFVVSADTVILAAGGIGSPRILRESGFANAGQGLTVDSTLMVYGTTSAAGIGSEPPMTWQWRSPDDGFLLSTLIDPWLMYPLAVAQTGLAHTTSWAQWSNILGIMIKIKDDLSGEVQQHGISKPTTANDRERLTQAEQIARRILREAGAKPESLIVTSLRGTHPGSSVRIGTLVDQQLQTELHGLYVCDASVFPEALARPTVLTIIGLGKRLAKQLTR